MALVREDYNKGIYAAESDNNPKARGYMHPAMDAPARGKQQLTARTARGLVNNFPDEFPELRGMSGKKILDIMENDEKLQDRLQDALITDQQNTLNNIQPGAGDDPQAMALLHRFGTRAARSYLSGDLDMGSPVTENEAETPAQYLNRFNRSRTSKASAEVRPSSPDMSKPQPRFEPATTPKLPASIGGNVQASLPKKPGGYTDGPGNMRGEDLPPQPYFETRSPSGSRRFSDRPSPSSMPDMMDRGQPGPAPTDNVARSSDAPQAPTNYAFEPESPRMPGFNVAPEPAYSEVGTAADMFRRPQGTYLPQGATNGAPAVNWRNDGEAPIPMDPGLPSGVPAPGIPIQNKNTTEPAGLMQGAEAAGNAASQSGGGIAGKLAAAFGSRMDGEPQQEEQGTWIPGVEDPNAPLQTTARQAKLIARAENKAAAAAGRGNDKRADKFNRKADRIRERAAEGKSSFLERMLAANEPQRPYRQEKWADYYNIKKQEGRMARDPENDKLAIDAQAKIDAANNSTGSSMIGPGAFNPHVQGPQPVWRRNSLGR